MAKVFIDPDAESYPILPTAGRYGNGLDHPADVELTGFEWPATERLPAYDKENERGPYAYFGFMVQLHDGPKVFYDEWQEISAQSGSKAPQFARDLGIKLEETELDGRATVAFEVDDDTGMPIMEDGTVLALPHKIVGIEVRDPRKGKTGRMYNGNLTGILGN